MELTITASIQTKNLFENKLVRKALSLALDRTLIVEKVTKGGQLEAFSFTHHQIQIHTSLQQNLNTILKKLENY